MYSERELEGFWGGHMVFRGNGRGNQLLPTEYRKLTANEQPMRGIRALEGNQSDLHHTSKSSDPHSPPPPPLPGDK